MNNDDEKVYSTGLRGEEKEADAFGLDGLSDNGLHFCTVLKIYQTWLVIVIIIKNYNYK